MLANPITLKSYFENEKDYASATNNISIIDTLNKSVINGHYGEIFKAKDSAIITRRAMAINISDCFLSPPDTDSYHTMSCM